MLLLKIDHRIRCIGSLLCKSLDFVVKLFQFDFGYSLFLLLDDTRSSSFRSLSNRVNVACSSCNFCSAFLCTSLGNNDISDHVVYESKGRNTSIFFSCSRSVTHCSFPPLVLCSSSCFRSSREVAFATRSSATNRSYTRTSSPLPVGGAPPLSVPLGS
jgi:hypothetical protein